MLNYIWSALLITGLVAGALFGRLEGMVTSLWIMCKDVVMVIALPLAGTMMLWLGIMRVMEKAGIMEMLARALSPVLCLLFPGVPRNHPAMGAITMNIAANMLGLGNAATPMGLKAMTHLQELNPHKRSASNAMCMFLAINTAGIALIPTTGINFLAAGGMSSPQSIIAPAFIASTFGTLVAVAAALLLSRMRRFKDSPKDEEFTESPHETVDTAEESVVVDKQVPAGMGTKVLLVAVLVAFGIGGALYFTPGLRQQILDKTGLQAVLNAETERKAVAAAQKEQVKAPGPAVEAAGKAPITWKDYVHHVSTLAVPAIILLAIAAGLWRGVRVYDEMVDGAKEGFGIAVKIMPYIVVMLTALTFFRESGALLLLEQVLRPLLQTVGMPVELLPMAIMRSLSGSGSGGILSELVLQPTLPDFIKYTAAIIYGSSETTFYVLAVYFGSVGIKRIRHSLAAGLIADVAGIVGAVAVGRMIFT